MTESADLIRGLIQDVPDFPKPGIVFKDLAPVFAHGAAYRAMTAAFAERYRGKVDAVVGIDARGFVVGGPVAVALGLGLVLVRKKGKLPPAVKSITYDLEYGQDTLEIKEGALQAGMKVLAVDDLLATGGTMGATCDLVRAQGAEVVEAAFVVELGFLPGRKRLEGTPCFSLVQY